MSREFCLALATFGFSALIAALSRTSTFAEDEIDFSRGIRPILAEYCFACHGHDDQTRAAGLRLDVRDEAVDAGAIVPGDADDSELIYRVFADDPDEVMPPPESKKALSAEQKNLLRQWVEEGADYQRHWSFEAPERTLVPEDVTGWSKNQIDQFVFRRMKAAGLKPNAEAAPEQLFRRLHLDITGLPPEPEQTGQFVSDYRENNDKAVAAWVDRLMATPAWGEHRARYWLDAARYADTHGLHFDNYREMWPYRDWVIRSFNANQPFDEFTIEQLAGDLLTDPTTDQLVATGFQRCNMTTNEGGTIDQENLAIYAADRVQTLGWVYLGLTTNCCQCHDHKFDPLTMKDYYSLAAFFRNTEQGGKDGNVKDGMSPVISIPAESDLARWNELETLISQAKQRTVDYREAVAGDIDDWAKGLTAESVRRRVPDSDLALLAKLNEGPDAKKVTALPNAIPISFTGDAEWSESGQIGPAPIIRKQQTILAETEIANFKCEQAFSVGAWVKPGHPVNSGAIVARMHVENHHRGWDLWQNGGGYAFHLIDRWPKNALKVATAENVVTPGEWQHVLVTYDGSLKPEGVRLYVDGRVMPTRTEMSTLKPDAVTTTVTPLRIGQRSNGAVFEDSEVQDLRIYQRKLDSKEAFALAKAEEIARIVGLPQMERPIDETQRSILQDYYLTLEDAVYPTLAAEVAELVEEQTSIRERSPITHVQREKTGSEAQAHILMRGQYDQPGEKVSAATPGSLHPFADELPRNRLGLARWIVDPDNPLTARVTVNRFWQEVFGRGIVRTSEDFGIMGEPPSHPELLDWLAGEFVDSGWDVKQLFRLMLTSATYRQSAAASPVQLRIDPQNRMLSCGPRFRMDAEMIRDGALHASGLLSRRMFGPGAKPYQPPEIWSIVGMPESDTRKYVQDEGEGLYRRSIYSFWKRMAPPPNLETFDAPKREVCTVRRARTNTPLQALVTLNDPQFIEAARKLAESGMLRVESTDSELVAFVWTRVIGRPIKAREAKILLSSKDALQQHYLENQQQAEQLIAIGESQSDPALDVAELAAWTLVCNQIMNLDEALNK